MKNSKAKQALWNFSRPYLTNTILDKNGHSKVAGRFASDNLWLFKIDCIMRMALSSSSSFLCSFNGMHFLPVLPFYCGKFSNRLTQNLFNFLLVHSAVQYFISQYSSSSRNIQEIDNTFLFCNEFMTLFIKI